MKTTIEEYMRKVDSFISGHCGLVSADLPDCNYAQWLEDGVTARSAASRAIRNAGD